MSTYYRELAEPWSSVIRTVHHHIRLHLFVDGKKSGELVFGPEQVIEADSAMRGLCGAEVAQISARRDGPELIYLEKSRTDTVIGDYGEVTTLTALVKDYPQGDSWGAVLPKTLNLTAAEWLKTT